MFTGSLIVTGTGASEYTFIRSADYQRVVGRTFDQVRDVVMVMNGDRNAGGYMAPWWTIYNPANGDINIAGSQTMSGPRRFNYAIIAG